jgi:two-component system sensor histidine kinase TctE
VRGTRGAWSLRQRLLAWLLAPLVLWSLGSSGLAYLLALHFTTQAYDRSLHASILDIERQLRVVDGRAAIDLPPAAIQILEWNDEDRVYYRVATASGQHIAGDPRLPLPPTVATGHTRYFDARFGNATVRAAAAMVPVPGANEAVLVQVAETTDARRSITGEILAATLLPEGVLITLAAIGMWYGVGRGLDPLERLREEVGRRSDQDLSPVAAQRTPREVRPLVNAINGLLSRLDSALSAHRRFVANAAHQLRTPLAGLHTQAELALRASNPETVRRSLEQLHQAAGRAAHLVGQLMSLARLEPRSARPLQAEPLDLKELARATTARWVPQALGRGVDLGFDAVSAPAQVVGDRLLLEEMLGNLIDNAIRYTPPGGEATVRVVHAANAAVVEVEDSGPGIPENERPQVMERFQRGSNAAQTPGSGLGLAIVREIAVTHGAEVRLEAGHEGRGTRVSVVLPSPA